ALDELDLDATDGVAVLLHVEVDRLLHGVTEAGERTGVMQDDADLDDVFGVRRRGGHEFQTAHVSSPWWALTARCAIIARKRGGDNGACSGRCRPWASAQSGRVRNRGRP